MILRIPWIHPWVFASPNWPFVNVFDDLSIDLLDSFLTFRRIPHSYDHFHIWFHHLFLNVHFTFLRETKAASHRKSSEQRSKVVNGSPVHSAPEDVAARVGKSFPIFWDGNL